MGLVSLDADCEHLALSPHGHALTHEYLLRDHRAPNPTGPCSWRSSPLVIQPTLELLTPMVQDPHRLLRLAQMAEVETLDTMVGLRVGSDYPHRALDLGLTLEEMKQLAGGGGGLRSAPALAQLLEDLARRLGKWKSSRAAGWCGPAPRVWPKNSACARNWPPCISSPFPTR